MAQNFYAVHNPAVPSAHVIPGSMGPGREVRVHGVVHNDANQFSINLQCGPSLHFKDDIAFHFNPRLSQGHVIGNELRREWGHEERFRGMPFARGKPFDVVMTCSENSYLVSVNGKQYCEFQRRLLGMASVTYVVVQGDVNVQLLEIK